MRSREEEREKSARDRQLSIGEEGRYRSNILNLRQEIELSLFGRKGLLNHETESILCYKESIPNRFPIDSDSHVCENRPSVKRRNAAAAVTNPTKIAPSRESDTLLSFSLFL